MSNGAPMNCLEFRRAIAAEPASTRADLAAHRASCARCADAYAQAQAFEAQLSRVLALPVPAELAERVLLRQTTAAQQHKQQVRRFGTWRAAAALLLVGVGIASGWWLTRALRPLPDLAVAHLAHEPYALSARAQVPDAKVRDAFVRSGVPLRGDPGTVDYLNACALGFDPIVHMVVPARSGPVTVYYVPGREEPRSAWQRDGVRGRTVPAGRGTLVLLASQDDAFDAVELRWRGALDAAPADALGQP